MDSRQSSAKASKFSRNAAFFLLRFEDGRDALGQLGNLLRKLSDGLFPVGYVGQLVVEEEFEDVNQLVGDSMESSKAIRLS